MRRTATQLALIALVILVGWLAGVGGAWLLRDGPAATGAAYARAFRDVQTTMAPGVLVALLFGVYWTFVTRKLGAPPDPPAFLHPTLIAAAFVLTVVPVPGLYGRLLPPSAMILAAGLAIEGAGVVVSVLARRSARLQRWLRRPGEIGGLALFLGLAVQSGRLAALAGLGLAAIAYGRRAVLATPGAANLR
ncbi:MAG TPA: hypothetical protein VKU90_13325 [Caulobacteraceae bacterium]|nr:hypothetical protein [Caulobacteraceae bacterium]